MDRRFRPLALVLLALGAGACMPTTPETVFSWNVNDRIGSRVNPGPARTAAYHAPRAPAKRSHARTYVYESAAAPRADSSAVVSVPLPQARPQPADAGIAHRAPPADRGQEHSTETFVWPANGRVISGFGSTYDGARNDGINIATAMDAPIHAAAAGTVIYSGNELKGYGNLVLIKHADDYVTAYAHADRVIVKRGEHVARGQVIGYAGTTGNVNSPQVHFEIRRDTTPVNPRTMLAARDS